MDRLEMGEILRRYREAVITENMASKAVIRAGEAARKVYKRESRAGIGMDHDRIVESVAREAEAREKWLVARDNLRQAWAAVSAAADRAGGVEVGRL